MAEQTVALKSDASSTVATMLVDQVGSNIIGCSKIIVGADDTNDGFVSSANPLPVSGAVTVSGVATAANQSTANTALAAIETAVEAIQAAQLADGHNVTIDNASIAVTGTFWQETQPVSLASVPSHAVTNDGTFAVQAAQSGSWAVDLGATDNAVLDAIAASVAGTLTVASHEVTNAGAFAVQAAQSGSWTVDLGATDNAVLDAIAASVAGTLTVASHAVTNAGTFAVQVDAALPAGTNNIGDVDIASAIPAGTNLIGRVSASSETSTVYDGTTALTPKFAPIAASSSGNNTLVAAVTGKKIRVLAYNLMGNGAVNAKFQSGAGGTDLTGLKYIAAAGSGICAPFNPVGWFETASNTLLNLNLSGAVAVGGELVYVEV